MIYSLQSHEYQIQGKACPPFAYWDGGFTPPELEALDKVFATNKNEKGGVGGGGKGIVDLNVRNSDLKFTFVNEELDWFRQRASFIINSLNGQYYRFDISSYEAFQFTTYKGDEKGHYDWHIDSHHEAVTNDIRKLSFVMFMSNPSEFDGGQLEIMIGKDPLIVEQVKGRVVVFPSYTVHRVSPVTRGLRKSIVTWTHGPLFR